MTKLGITTEGGTGGLPEDFGRKKRDVFAAIIDKVRQRSQSWTSRFLSQAGKQVLLKTILSSMPTYSMSNLKLPVSLCKQLTSILTRFWWDAKPNDRRMAWVSWDKMTRPKNAGGLGFRDFEAFNDALLAKLGWRIIQAPESLFARVFLSKYCQNTTFLEAKASSNSSHGWKGILAGREVLKLGDGEWEMELTSLGGPVALNGRTDDSDGTSSAIHLLKVSDLKLPHSNEWNWNMIRTVLPQYEEHIRLLPTSSQRRGDKIVWLPVKSGQYSTRSGYGLSTVRECKRRKTLTGRRTSGK